jgi:hypothetical protein
VEISDRELDRLIISSTLPDRQKVAMVIARSLDRLDMHVDADRLAARIAHLVSCRPGREPGQPVAWRHGEIRLAAQDR